MNDAPFGKVKSDRLLDHALQYLNIFAIDQNRVISCSKHNVHVIRDSIVIITFRYM